MRRHLILLAAFLLLALVACSSHSHQSSHPQSTETVARREQARWCQPQQPCRTATTADDESDDSTTTSTTVRPTTTTVRPTTTTARPTTTTGRPPTTTTPPPTTTSPPGIRYWSATHEAGNLAEWDANGGGGMFPSGNYTVAASRDVAHTGAWSMKDTVWTPPTSGTRAFRWQEPRQHREGYYSAWLYLPVKLNPAGSFINMFQFKSRPADNSRNDPFWAFYGASDGAGGFFLRAGWGWGGTPVSGPHSTDGVGGKWIEPAQRVSVPAGRWVHFEAYLYESKDFDGRLRFWQDGVLLFDLANIRTSFNNCNFNAWCTANEWSINLYGDAITPSPSIGYWDDAAIGSTYIP